MKEKTPMATIQINTLNPANSKLFVADESFITELSNVETTTVQGSGGVRGGVVFPLYAHLF